MVKLGRVNNYKRYMPEMGYNIRRVKNVASGGFC